MIKIKKNKPQVKIEPLQHIGRDEMNLAEFPIAFLSRQTDKKKFSFQKERILTLPGGALLHQKWTVSATPKYGFPQPRDEDVFLGLFQIASKCRFSSPKVHFTQKDLLRIIGWPIDGTSRKRLKLALARLKTTSILAQDAFWDNKNKVHVTRHFGIIDDYQLFERKKGEPSTYEAAISFNWVRFSDKFFESIQAGYIKPIDLKLYFSLGSPIAKRLFRYLDKKRYQKERYEIDLYQLASVHVGLSETRCRYPSWIKEELDKAHHELQKGGFLKSVQYEKTKKGSWKVIYGFGKTKFGADSLSAGGHPPALSEAQQAGAQAGPYKEIEEALVSRGVSRKVAQELVESKAGSFIEKQIDVFDFLRETKSERLAENPSGFLTKAIRDEWVIKPAGYVPKEERIRRIQAQEEEEKVKRDEEEMEKQEQEALQRIRESLPVEVLENLRAEALEEARQKLGRVYRVQVNSPIVEAFFSGLLRERYLDTAGR